MRLGGFRVGKGMVSPGPPGLASPSKKSIRMAPGRIPGYYPRQPGSKDIGHEAWSPQARCPAVPRESVEDSRLADGPLLLVLMHPPVPLSETATSDRNK